MRQVGIRSVDPGERRFVHDHELPVFDMRSIDEMGVRRAMELALDGLTPDTHVHVSFDVDFLGSEIAPGVGTTVAGGMTYREAQLCMEMIADTGLVGSLDIMELNPALDVRNKTAALAVDLVESLFGKSTLMRLPGPSGDADWAQRESGAVRATVGMRAEGRDTGRGHAGRSRDRLTAPLPSSARQARRITVGPARRVRAALLVFALILADTIARIPDRSEDLRHGRSPA